MFFVKFIGQDQEDRALYNKTSKHVTQLVDLFYSFLTFKSFQNCIEKVITTESLQETN